MHYVGGFPLLTYKYMYFKYLSKPEIEGPAFPKKTPVVTNTVPASSSKEQEAIKTSP